MYIYILTASMEKRDKNHDKNGILEVLKSLLLG